MVEVINNNPVLKDCPVIPVVHTELYKVIECSFAKAKEAGIKYWEEICKDLSDDTLGLINVWEGEELWMPYSVTHTDTFTLLTEDKHGNKYDFRNIRLDTNRTKIQNNDFSVKQVLELHGNIIKPGGDNIDIHKERIRRNNEIAYRLDSQYLQVKLVAGTKCEFAKAAKYNVKGAYTDIGYKDDTPGHIILTERGPVWIPENQSWGTLREIEKSDKQEVICGINIKDFELKEENGVINIDFHRVDTSCCGEEQPANNHLQNIIDDAFDGTHF